MRRLKRYSLGLAGLAVAALAVVPISASCGAGGGGFGMGSWQWSGSCAAPTRSQKDLQELQNHPPQSRGAGDLYRRAAQAAPGLISEGVVRASGSN